MSPVAKLDGAKEVGACNINCFGYCYILDNVSMLSLCSAISI